VHRGVRLSRSRSNLLVDSLEFNDFAPCAISDTAGCSASQPADPGIAPFPARRSLAVPAIVLNSEAQVASQSADLTALAFSP
jgi:hypothetical protein